MKQFLYNSHRGERKKGGYILILSLLIISILLAVGFGIYSISVRDIILSSFLRDSEKALSAADRGVECALYWDRSTGAALNGLPYTIFATGTIPTYYSYPPLGGVNCDGTNFTTSWTHSETPVTGTTDFTLNFADGTCVDVTVVKTGSESTQIISDGYNTCDVDFSRRTQREIAVFTNL